MSRRVVSSIKFWRSSRTSSRSRQIPVLRSHYHYAVWETETQKVVVPSSCWFSSSPHQKKRTCPFQVLGLNKSSTTTTYAHAKQRFLKLALQHHPDTNNSQLHHHPTDVDNHSNQHNNVDRFLEIRAAFESLVEAPDGTVKVISQTTNTQGHDDDDDTVFQEWFTFETGGLHAYPERLQNNPDLVAEIARTTQHMSSGGLDRGGMWQLAQEMQRVHALASQPNNMKPLPKRLECSTTHTDSNHSSTTTSRRRRKR